MKDFIVQLFLTLIAAAIFGMTGYSIGYTRGSDAAWEANRKVDCEIDYQFKPINEVPVKCLKYFDLPKK